MFRLALDLGMTVGELGRRISGNELMEWLAFYQMQSGQGVINVDRLEGKDLDNFKTTFKNFKKRFESK